MSQHELLSRTRITTLLSTKKKKQIAWHLPGKCSTNKLKTSTTITQIVATLLNTRVKEGVHVSVHLSVFVCMFDRIWDNIA